MLSRSPPGTKTEKVLCPDVSSSMLFILIFIIIILELELDADANCCMLMSLPTERWYCSLIPLHTLYLWLKATCILYSNNGSVERLQSIHFFKVSKYWALMTFPMPIVIHLCVFVRPAVRDLFWLLEEGGSAPKSCQGGNGKNASISSNWMVSEGIRSKDALIAGSILIVLISLSSYWRGNMSRSK